MNSKTNIVLTLGIGVIIIAVTLVLFFVGFSSGEKTTLDWLSILFVLISEIAFITGLILMKKPMQAMNATMLKAGLLSALLIYFVITVLLAIFTSFFGKNLNAFVSTQVTICGIVAIVVIALISASAKD